MFDSQHILEWRVTDVVFTHICACLQRNLEMVDIVGISSGRKNKVSDSLVKAILQGTGREYTFINLSGKLIRPCEACNGCVDTNRCVLKDDLVPILDKCCEAQAIVFGAPRHWNHMNAKGLAFWERACFSGRHNSVFPLQAKLGVIVGVAGGGDARCVIQDLEIYFDDARMYLVKTISAQGEYACFSCGYGNYCPVGGFAELFPLGTPIAESITPSIRNQYPEIPDIESERRNLLPIATEIGKTLDKVLEIKQKKGKRI